ncbi:hypothetical protein [Streptomyces rochei]
MSTLALLVLVIGIAVGLVVIGGAAYLVHRHPPLLGPSTVAAAVATALIALVAAVVQTGPQGGGAGTRTVAPTDL